MSRYAKILSTILTVALIVTLIPPLTSVQANAPYISIEALPTSQDKALSVTTEFIDIEIVYSNISDTNLNRLTYEIENVTTGQIRDGSNNVPVKVGNEYRAVFRDVQLFQGLNKITVTYDSSYHSQPAYVRFTDAPSINLMIGNQAFRNNDFIPRTTNTPSPIVVIDGTASNVSTVIGSTTLSGAGLPVGVQGDRFSFVIGEEGTNLRARPGDNDFKVTAANQSREYSTERMFVYNNGKSFLFNTRITGQPGFETPEEVMLFREPSLEVSSSTSSGSFQIEVTTDIKINRVETEATHPNITLTFNGKNPQTVALPAPSSTESTDQYYIYKNVRIQIPIDSDQYRQVVDVVFSDPNTFYENHHQSFVFYYVNRNDAYVKDVFFKDGNKLVSGSEINVTRSSVIEFEVETGGEQPDAIRVEVRDPEGTAREITPDFTTIQNGRFQVQIDRNDMPEGYSIIKFTPIKDGTKYGSGAREYLVNYNPTPYFYLTNIKSSYDNEAKPQTINFKAVNIPQNEWRNIYVTLNGVGGRVSDINNDPIVFNYRGAGADIQNGLNEIVIQYFPGGDSNRTPIATFRYEFFYFDGNIPEVTRLRIPQSDIDSGRFVVLDGSSSRYYTHETAFRFEGAYSRATRLEFIVRGLDSDNNSVTTKWVYVRGAAGFDFIPSESTANETSVVSFSYPANSYETGTFTSRTLGSRMTGTYSVEVIASSSTGITNNKAIEIVREPATFIVHYPKLDPKTNTATVNGNFVRLYIEAEGADKIIYDKNKEVTDLHSINGMAENVFIFDIKGLKRGNNKISFTVVRGDRQEKAEFTLINADTTVIGAQFKESISKNRIRAFNNQVDLRFPKGTVLKINDDSASNQHLSPNRDILIAIADPIDGRVNKTLHSSVADFRHIFTNMSDRFRSASPLYWIDAGMYRGHAPSENEALYNGGVYPYERNQEFYRRNSTNHNNVFVPSQPGELTLAYDASIVQSGWRYVTVFHYSFDDSRGGYGWRNIGGVVNSKNNTISVPFHEFGYYKVMYMYRSFSDVIGHDWARNHLDTLYSKGIMQPKQEARNLFISNDNITRGEFVTLLAKAFEIPLNYSGRNTFPDVGPDRATDGTYEYKYIETAARAGIVRGNSQGLFEPNLQITREDAAVMIARAANLKLETNLERARQQIDKQFTDLNSFSDYTIPAVLAVHKAKIIEGKPNALSSNNKPTYYFAPKAFLTRAEAAAIVMRVMLNAKKIPHL